MRINYDFLDLEAFLAVKETGSFHLAAERLSLSQSSVTRRIRKLEDALDTVLFDRTTRDVRPTLSAKRLQLRAETILQEAQETTLAMRDESAAFAYQRAQTVTFSTIPTVVDALISPALAKFADLQPGARVRMLDHAANEVAEAVSEGEADFGICSLPSLEPVTEFELLLTDALVLALPVGHRLEAKTQINWADLEAERLILPARGTGNRLLIDEALARTGSALRWTYEVGRSSTALDLVKRGIGVAPLPRLALGQAHASQVVWRPIGPPEVERSIGLVTRIGQADTPTMRALRDSLRERASELAKR